MTEIETEIILNVTLKKINRLVSMKLFKHLILNSLIIFYSLNICLCSQKII